MNPVLRASTHGPAGWALKFATALALICGGGVGLASAEPYRFLFVERPPVTVDDQHLRSEPSSSDLQEFVIDDNGVIVDGPSNRDGDAVDLSNLLSNETILANFEMLAFGGGEMAKKYRSEDPAIYRGLSTIVRKYEGRVVVSDYLFREGDPAPFRKVIQRALRDISKATNQTIEFVPDGDESAGKNQVFVVYVDSIDHAKSMVSTIEAYIAIPEVEEIVKESYIGVLKNLQRLISASENSKNAAHLCFIHITLSDDFELSGQMFFLPTFLNELDLESCVYEELYQSMGLSNDNDEAFNSKFTDSFKHFHVPTEADWLLLELLYDPRIKNGDSRDRVMQIVKERLEARRKD